MKYILNNRYILYFIIIVLTLLLGRQCNTTHRFSSNNEALQDSIHTYKLSNNQLVTEKKALVVTEKELRKGVFVKDDSLKALLKKFKDPKVSTVVKTITVIDSVKIPVKDNRFSSKEKLFNIEGRIDSEYLLIDNFKLNNTQRVVTGIRRGWFQDELVTSVTNSNPLVTTEDIVSQTVKVPLRRFNIAVFAGANYLGKPTIGIGLSYTLIRL